MENGVSVSIKQEPVLARCYHGYERSFNFENKVVVGVCDSEVISPSPLLCDDQINWMSS